MSVFSGYYLQFKLFELQNGFHCIESLGYFMIPNKALKCFMAVKDPQWTYLNLTWPSMIIYSPLLHCMLWLLFQDLWAFSIPFLLLMNCVCWMMAIAIRGYWRGHGQGHEQWQWQAVWCRMRIWAPPRLTLEQVAWKTQMAPLSLSSLYCVFMWLIGLPAMKNDQFLCSQ